MEPLSPFKRGIASAISLGGLAGGTFGVFESGNQAGTVALLTIGAFSGAFAMVGKIPLRWVVAGTEVDMSYEESRDTADALAQFLTAEQLAIVTKQILELAGQQPPSANQLQLAASLSRASSAEVEGHSRMRRFATLTEGWTYEPATEGIGADGMMKTPDGELIAVDFKSWGEGASRQRWHQRVQLLNNRLPDVLERTGAKGLLVLVDATIATPEIGEFPSALRRPMRIATFADSYQFLLEKFEELRVWKSSDSA
ncbi:hypothetical protein [Aeromicrobium sp. JJY06]|uniref:hypothetical protein n=1 Tax=Aeromicrobium sp. JJY06 TaxID=3373478 RepID=UPI00376EF63F